MGAWVWLSGVLVVGALLATACGPAGDTEPSGTPAPAGEPAATQEPQPAPLPTAQEEERAETAAVSASPNADLFLPADATMTPRGEAILRDDQRPRAYGVGWGTNWGVRTIELAELASGGPPRDGIPSIDAPRFLTVAETEALGLYQDNSPVIQFALEEDVRAYPLAILTWHEIVNDVVGGVPVAVTFCPLCNSAITFDRRVGGRTLEFGTSGLLRNSDLVMYDRTTESLWQQIGGRAIVGDMVGAELDVYPSPIVSWAQFRTAFPDGLVLSQETGFVRDYGRNPYRGYDDIRNTPFLYRGQLDERLSPFERVVTLERHDQIVAYPFPLLEEVRVVADDLGGEPIVVFWTPGASSALDARVIDEGREVGATGVFQRTVDGRTLEFDANPDDDQTFLDRETGSVWNVFGEAVSGPLAGSELRPVPHGNHFWFAWAAFQPDTIVVTQVE